MHCCDWLLELCRLTELKSQKQKMTNQLRSRDEEVDDLLKKLELAKQDARKAEKSKKEVCSVC